MTEKNGILQFILSFGKEKDLGEYNRKLLNRIWNPKKKGEKYTIIENGRRIFKRFQRGGGEY